MTDTLARPVTTPVLGAPLNRVDGPKKTTGAATFSTEYPLANIAYAALVHATVAHARIRYVDTSAADGMPGIVKVLTHLNAPELKPTPKPSMIDLSTLAAGTLVNYLNTDEVMFDGQPVAVVVAESLEQAQAAADLVRVEYDPLPADLDFEAGRSGAALVKSPPIGVKLGGKKGDAEEALRAAEVKVDLTFNTPEQTHNALEPHSTTAVWDGDLLTLYDGTQSIDWFQTHLAKKFGVPKNNVRIVAPFVGGAFGGKGSVWAGTVLAIMAARVVDRPIRLMLTREGVYRTVGGRTASTQRLALGADRTGHLTSLIHQATTRKGHVGGGDEQVVSASIDLYAADNLLCEQRAMNLHLVPNTSMRAPGEAIGTFALESAVDVLAHELGMDPVDLRLRNEAKSGPTDGKAFSHHLAAETLRLGAEKFGWAQRSAEPGSMRDGNHYVGWGAATAFHPAWEFLAKVELTLDVAGTLAVKCAFHEMGMGAATATAQMAAHLMGLPPGRVTVEYGDSALPTGPSAGGSAQTASIAAALVRGCGLLLADLHALARKQPGSPLRGTPKRDVEAHDARLHVGAASQSFTDILTRAGQTQLQAQVGKDTRWGNISGQSRFMTKLFRDGRKWMKASSGAHFCEVRIDADTGEIRVTRWVGAFDIGRVVNAKTAASQLRGGIVMGLGLALSEETLIDPRTGRIMNPSLTEYHTPVHADVPAIEIHMIDDPDPTMPLGVLGAGEVGIVGVGAAVANAVFHATGKRVLDLPITLDKVLP
jgi:xanthine dehydrogenase YagR molybdenum-binding subunit